MDKINYVPLCLLYPETCSNPGKLGNSIRERLLLYNQVSLIQMPAVHVYNTVKTVFAIWKKKKNPGNLSLLTHSISLLYL